MERAAVGAAAKALPRAPRARRADLAPAGVFKKEVSDMMYAFGDAEEPLAATVAVVEEIVVDYIYTVSRLATASQLAPGKLECQDVLLTVRKDERKLKRGQELYELYDVVKKARSNFENTTTCAVSTEDALG